MNRVVVVVNSTIAKMASYRKMVWLACRDRRLHRGPKRGSAGQNHRSPCTMNKTRKPESRRLIVALVQLAAAVLQIVNQHWPF